MPGDLNRFVFVDGSRWSKSITQGGKTPPQSMHGTFFNVASISDRRFAFRRLRAFSFAWMELPGVFLASSSVFIRFALMSGLERMNAAM